MLIREIILQENDSYQGLLTAIRDLLTMHQLTGNKEISTPDFIKQLSDEGYPVDTATLIQAVDASGFAASVNSTTIVPKGELPAEVTAGEEQADVSKIAGTQAMKDIKSEL